MASEQGLASTEHGAEQQELVRFARGNTVCMDLAAKLQLEPGWGIAVSNVPAGVRLELTGQHDAGAAKAPAADALLTFVVNRAELDQRAPELVAAAQRGVLTWVAYPKAKQLGTDLNRDRVAAMLLERGVQPVRQVSIDETWSALRLRPA